jgi:hypothetical protein
MVNKIPVAYDESDLSCTAATDGRLAGRHGRVCEAGQMV